jgi:hypothetical protein
MSSGLSRSAQNPGHIDKFGKIDLAPTSPLTVNSGHHEQTVIEQDFHVQVIRQLIADSRRRNPSKDEIEFSFPQPR